MNRRVEPFEPELTRDKLSRGLDKAGDSPGIMTVMMTCSNDVAWLNKTDNEMIRTSQWIAVASAAILAGIGSADAVAQVVAVNDTLVGRSVSVDPSPLLAVEARVLPRCLTVGPAAHDTLSAYYLAANPEIVERFSEARRAFQHEASPRLRSITLIAGTAGIGKTFLKQEVMAQDLAPQAVCKFDLAELYAAWREAGRVRLKPDLHDDGLVLNWLPAIAEPRGDQLQSYLSAQAASFFVIDSLDELHPGEYEWVLHQIESFVAASPRPFVHVVVLGRPFAFRNYWQRHLLDLHQVSRVSAPDVQLFQLRAPEFRTTGDLQVSSWNYCVWKHKLAWAPAGGELEPLPLEHFQGWLAEGGGRSGRFASVVWQPQEASPVSSHLMLENWSRRSRVICSTLGNLAGNGMIREIAWEHANASGGDERPIREAYLQALLRRDTATDGRPSQTAPNYLDLYLRLLESIAVAYLPDAAADTHGTFTVAPDDQVQASFDGQSRTFKVQDILNRSGLGDLDPRQPGSPRYCFEPVWLHRHLVERAYVQRSESGTEARARE